MEQEPSVRSSLQWGVIALLVILVILGIGSIGKLSGTGWFGYRQFLYGEGQVYALNLGEKPVEVSVDGREPAELEPRGFAWLDLVGGTSEIVVRRAPSEGDGGQVQRFSVTADNSDVFLKAAGGGCLAAVDVSSFYASGNPKLEVVARIGAGDHLWVPESKNVIWPRQKFPDSMAGGSGRVLWVETVGCPLLEDKESEYLETYLKLKLQKRMEKSEGRGAAQ